MKFSRKMLTMLIMSALVATSLATVVDLRPGHVSNAYAASAIPSQYFAPYAELGQGASLQSVTQSTGQKYYTLAFMLGNGCQAEWDGTVPLSQASSDFPTLNSDIQYIRNQGEMWLLPLVVPLVRNWHRHAAAPAVYRHSIRQ